MVHPEVLRKRLTKLQEYLDIDRREVFAILTTHLNDIRSLSTVFADYL